MSEMREPKLASPSTAPAVPVAMNECVETVIALQTSVSDLREALKTVLPESPPTCGDDKPPVRNTCPLGNAIDDLLRDIHDVVSDLNMMRSQLQL